MGKFKMPTVQEFIKTKRIFGPIKDPVWVYLEREMQENTHKKPYNTRVANWLLFCKALRYHYYCEAKFKYKRLCRESGPPWYLEYSKEQRDILDNLKVYIHEDVLEDVSSRVKKALREIGVTVKIPHSVFMDAMLEAKEDPGAFMWILYHKVYKVPPSELRSYYDLDSMLMMSALVFIDLEECMDILEKITHGESATASTVQKKKPTYYEPKVKYGEYLQRMRVPVYSTHPATLPKPKKPPPFSPHNLKLRAKESYERLAMSTHFLELRKRRNVKEQIAARKCKYKFWEPPATLRNIDPAMAAYVIKVKMVKLKPKKTYLKLKPPYDNVQYIHGSVSYVGGKPVVHILSVGVLNTGGKLIHGGLIKWGSEFVTQICGMWKTVIINKNKCEKTCDCITWLDKANRHLEETKCKCAHRYDFDTLPKDVHHLEPKPHYFLPPTQHLPFLFDHAKIYNLDFRSEFTHDELMNALKSESEHSSSTEPAISFMNLSGKEILEILFGNISETPLIIPHLPQANRLNCLLEWVRKRLYGPHTAAQQKQLMLVSQRRWLDLSHIDFRAKAYLIPFTLKHLDNMTWAHRNMVQKLFKILLRNFEGRSQKYQLEQTRLWWPTMFYDAYPNKAFLDVFFTYMPCRYRDTLVLDPYCAGHYITVTSRPCPLAQPDAP